MKTDESEKTFTLHWIGGKTEVVKGETIATAMTAAGYGGGAVRALDYYSDGDVTGDEK